MTGQEIEKIVVLLNSNCKNQIMTGKLSMLLKKYSIPVLFFILGLLMLTTGLSKGQNSMFMIAAVMMFVAGGLSILYSSGKFKSGVLYLIGLIAGAAGLYTIFMSWKSVEDTSTYNENYKMCKSLAKQNLEDIRYVQKAYAESNGTYLSDWNSLVDYVNNGTIPFVDAQGVVPGRKITVEENKYLYTGNPAIDNNMTENEAYRLSKWTDGPNWANDFVNFKRDTIQVSLLKTKFQSKSYMSSREKAGFHVFVADSLPYIPYTNAKQKWNLETKDSVKVGEAYLPSIRVSGKIPFASIKGKDGDKEEMFFGNLSSNDTAGSWEEE